MRPGMPYADQVFGQPVWCFQTFVQRPCFPFLWGGFPAKSNSNSSVWAACLGSRRPSRTKASAPTTGLCTEARRRISAIRRRPARRPPSRPMDDGSHRSHRVLMFPQVEWSIQVVFLGLPFQAVHRVSMLFFGFAASLYASIYRPPSQLVRSRSMNRNPQTILGGAMAEDLGNGPRQAGWAFGKERCLRSRHRAGRSRCELPFYPATC